MIKGVVFLNYEKFVSLVPQDTKEFIDALLPLFYYYKDDDKSIKTKESATFNYYTKILIIFLIAYAKKSQYYSLLSKYGFTEQDFTLSSDIDYNISLDKEFPFIRDFLPNVSDEGYCKLTATDILLNVIKMCADKVDFDHFISNFLPRASYMSNVAKELEKFSERDRKNLKAMVEREIFADLRVGVVNYLETANKLYSFFRGRTDFSREDTISLSLLFALFFYEDAPVKNNSFSEQQAITNVLAKKKVKLSDLRSKLKISFYESEVNGETANPFSIKEKYEKYILELEKQMKREDITVSDVFLKALDKKISNSLAIDKLLAKLGVGIDTFNNFKEEVEKDYNEENQLREERKRKEFLMDLDKDTKDFIEFTGKVYQLILEKRQNHLVNEKILVNEDDADTLALYIANCYYGLEVDEFFKEFGVTLEKVLKLLNLDISKKEIEAVSLDEMLMIERFNRFLHGGVNSKKSDIKPEDVILNLCDKEFNKSMIMENIFESLNHQVNLDKDFTKQMHEAIRVKILRKENELKEKIFHDLDTEVIDVLEKASAIYLMLSNKRKDLEKQDKKAISLLMSILYNDIFIRELFLTLGVSYEYILDEMGLKSLGEKVSLEIIQKDFGDYIFGGYNKNVERKNITVYSILKNIFNEELNNSVYYKRFLNDFSLSKEKVFSEYEKLSNEKQRELQEEKIKKDIKSFNKDVSYLIRQALYNYGKLENDFMLKKHEELITSKADLAYFSMILSVLAQECKEKEFFNDENITLENILNKLGVSLDLKTFEYEKIDYFKFENVFKNYFPLERQDITIKDVVESLFDSDNKVLEKIVKLFEGNYDRLEKEVKTGIFYEDSLTLSDRIEILNNAKINSLDDSYSSILNFDNELLFHAKYINKELPKLVQSKVHDNSVETINQVLSKVYSKEEKKESKKSFLRSLFGIEVNDKKEVNIVFNPDAINQLAQKIDEQIKILYNEFRQYEGMSNYIDAYRKKNNAMYEVATKKTAEVKEKLDKIDKNDEELFGDYLKLNTLYNALFDKTNRLLTTNQIMRQNLVSINQNMMMHVLTINTLKMARDDLIPLVISQLAITKGQATEKEGIELSENVFSLFQSLLYRNVEGALDNAKDLRRTIIDPETMDLIDKDIKNYVEQFELEKGDNISLTTQNLKEIGSSNDKEKILQITI